MTRNLGTLLFMISYFLGFFHNVPYLLLLLLILVTIFENLSVYMMLYNKNQSKLAVYLRKLGFLYMSYDLPSYKFSPILFTFDRLIYSFLMIYFMYLLLFTYPRPNIF